MAACSHFGNEYHYNFKTNWNRKSCNMSKITNLDLRNPFLNLVLLSGVYSPRNSFQVRSPLPLKMDTGSKGRSWIIRSNMKIIIV